jgi:hypothetical protein
MTFGRPVPQPALPPPFAPIGSTICSTTGATPEPSSTSPSTPPSPFVPPPLAPIPVCGAGGGVAKGMVAPMAMSVVAPVVEALKLMVEPLVDPIVEPKVALVVELRKARPSDVIALLESSMNYIV